MISLLISPREIEQILNPLLKNKLEFCSICLDDDNKLSFVLKHNHDYLTDLSIQVSLSCDSSTGKILFQSPKISSYTEDDGIWGSIKKTGKKVFLDSSLSLAEIIFRILPGTMTRDWLEYEAFGTVSFSLRNLAEAKKKKGKSEEFWSFLARIRFQSVSVRNNQLFLQAALEDN